jgi:uracil-DNA glycosylase
LNAPHPSPLSASKGWFGSKHFSKSNEYLKKNGKPEINWSNLPTQDD